MATQPWHHVFSPKVQAFAKLNCYFSFSASIIHIPKHAAALRAVPEDRLLLETDAPDQLPRSLRGGRSPQGEELGAAGREHMFVQMKMGFSTFFQLSTEVSESHLAEVRSGCWCCSGGWSVRPASPQRLMKKERTSPAAQQLVFSPVSGLVSRFQMDFECSS
eukprot:s84_g13.t1